MHRLRLFLAATWLWLRHDLHDFDLSKEPESQKRFRRWIAHGVQRMEYDPHTQWKYHLIATWFWIGNFFVVSLWLIFSRSSWDSLGVFYVAIASIYANGVSDFTGVHAAWAALRGDQLYLTKDDVVAVEQNIVETVPAAVEERLLVRLLEELPDRLVDKLHERLEKSDDL